MKTTLFLKRRRKVIACIILKRNYLDNIFLKIYFRDTQLDLLFLGHPAGSTIFGTPNWIYYFRDTQLDLLFSGHPAGSTIFGTPN